MSITYQLETYKTLMNRGAISGEEELMLDRNFRETFSDWVYNELTDYKNKNKIVLLLEIRTENKQSESKIVAYMSPYNTLPKNKRNSVNKFKYIYAMNDIVEGSNYCEILLSEYKNKYNRILLPMKIEYYNRMFWKDYLYSLTKSNDDDSIELYKVENNILYYVNWDALFEI